MAHTKLKPTKKLQLSNDDKVLNETTQYKLYKVNGVYFLLRKKDKKQIEILKDNVENYVLWGVKEFKNECKNTKFE